MATCLDAAGTTYPEEYKGNKIEPLVGKSLLPLIRGERGTVHTEPLFWEHEGNRAVRLGKFKLVQYWKEGREERWELYDMENDRTEMFNIADLMPEKVAEMKSLYDDWASDNQVRSWGEILQVIREKRESDRN
jgi:arylsulfatase